MKPRPVYLRQSVHAVLSGQRDLSRGERQLYRQALTCPFIRPRDAGLQARARELGLAPAAPRPLAPGQSLLVSVESVGTTARPGLWLLAAAEPFSGAETAPLVNAAAQALEQVTLITTFHIPLATSLRPLQEARALAAWHLFSPNGGPSAQLEGSSYGLAMLLAVVSLWYDRPLPADLCALATVDPTGRLGQVGSLPEKMAVVATSALGVGRVVVAPEQRDEARRLATELGEEHGVALSVLGDQERISGLLPQVFPEGAAAPGIADLGVDDASRLARDFYLLALESQPVVLGWGGIAAGARRVHEALADQGGAEEASRRARWAEQIARRHAGQPMLMDWPDEAWLAEQPRPLRLGLLAHVVQSAADGPPGHEQTYAQRALALVAPPGEEHDADLKLLGAAGRALAAAGQLQQATEHLQRAVRGWFDLFRPDDASYPLSEVLRVLGCAGPGAREELDQIEPWLRGVLEDPRTSMVSRAFVLLAAGRARICAEQPAAGLSHLEGKARGVRWELTPWHLQLSRLRWLARGQTALGRHGEGEKRRALLQQKTAELRGEHGHDTFLLLSNLDRARAEGSDPTPALAALRGCDERDELQRTAPAHLAPEEQIRRLADCHRY